MIHSISLTDEQSDFARTHFISLSKVLQNYIDEEIEKVRIRREELHKEFPPLTQKNKDLYKNDN